MANTEKLYVLGHPVAHSKSPAMYNAVYSRLGLSWEYGLADCPTEAEAQAFLDKKDFLSINITMPYKPHALASANARAASARLAKGANLLVRKGDLLIAYNTDGQGCIDYLERCGFVFADKSVAVCGTGPTSLAILHAAAQAGAREVVLLGRNKEKSSQVLQDYLSDFGLLANATIDLPAPKAHHRSFREAYNGCAFKYGSYATSHKTIAAADLIIDATPLGMKPDDPAPFDVELLREGQFVMDVVYGHGETALACAAREKGCTFVDGAGMLVGQALATVQIVCDIAGVDPSLSADEMFALMAQAAQFDLA